MLHKKLFLVMALCLGLIFVIGCSSDKENPVKPTEKTPPPEFKLRDITVPTKMMNSADEKAKLASSLIQASVSFEGTGCVFSKPDGATILSESTSAWEYTWTEGSLTKRLAITSLSSINQRKWQLYYTGSANDVTYEDDWRFMDAGQSMDMSSGHVYVYKDNTKQIILEWTWRTSNNVYTFEKYDHSETKCKVEIIVKPDGSGKVERFSMSTTGSLMHDLLVNWTADGSGTWWTYDNGINIGSGSWN